MGEYSCKMKAERMTWRTHNLSKDHVRANAKINLDDLRKIEIDQRTRVEHLGTHAGKVRDKIAV
jgi:hypothetical protein